MCKSCYSTTRNRQIAHGRWESLRPAAPVRAHIDDLEAAGLSRGQIYRLAGLSHATFYAVINGRDGGRRPERVASATAEAILSVDIPKSVAELIAMSTGRDHVPAIGTQRRLRALVALGWPMNILAWELGVTSAALHPLIHSRVRVMTYRHHEVVALFDRLQWQVGPSDAARAYARDRKWALPFQWDEASIDEPNGRPEPGSRRRAARVAS